MNRINKILVFLFLLLFTNKLSYGNNYKDTLYEKVKNALNEAVTFNQKMEKEGTPEKRNFLINVEYENNNEPNTFRQIIGKDKNNNSTGFTFPDTEITELKNRVLKINQENTNYYTFLLFVNYIPYDYYNDYAKDYAPYVDKFYNSNISSSWGDNKASYEYNSWEKQRVEHERANMKSLSVRASEFGSILNLNTNGKKIRIVSVFEFVGFKMAYPEDKLNVNNTIDYNVDINNEITYGNYTRTALNMTLFQDMEMQDFMGVKSAITYPAISTAGVKSFKEVALYDLENGVSMLESITAALNIRKDLEQNLDSYINEVMGIIHTNAGWPAIDAPSLQQGSPLEWGYKFKRLIKLLQTADVYTTSNSITYAQRVNLLKIFSAYNKTGARLQEVYQPIIVKLLNTIPQNQRNLFIKTLSDKTDANFYNNLCYKNQIGGSFNYSLLYTLYDNVTDNKDAELSYSSFIIALRYLIQSESDDKIQALLLKLQNATIDEATEMYVLQKEAFTTRIIRTNCRRELVDRFTMEICDDTWIYPPRGVSKFKASLNIDGTVTVTKTIADGKGNTNTLPSYTYQDPLRMIYLTTTDNVSLLNPVLKMMHNGYTDTRTDKLETNDSIAFAPVIALVYANDKQKRQDENEDAIAAMKALRFTLDALAIVVPIARLGSFATMSVARQMTFILVEAGMALSAANDMADLFTNGSWNVNHPVLHSFFDLYNKFVLTYCVLHLGKIGISKLLNKNKDEVLTKLRELNDLRDKASRYLQENQNVLSQQEKEAFKYISYKLNQTLSQAEGIVGIKEFWIEEVGAIAQISRKEFKELAKFLSNLKKPSPSGVSIIIPFADNTERLLINATNDKLVLKSVASIDAEVSSATVLRKPPYSLSAESGAAVINNKDLLVAVQSNNKIKMLLADTIYFSAARFAVTLGAQFTPYINSKLNDLYAKLIGPSYKITDAEATVFMENLCKVSTPAAKQNLIDFIGKLNNVYSGYTLQSHLASKAKNFNNFTQELAENNLFTKCIEVLQTPSKAYDEMVIATTKGLHTTAPSYFNFLRNAATQSFTQELDAVLVTGNFTSLRNKLVALANNYTNAAAKARALARYASNAAFRDEFVKLYNQISPKGALKPFTNVVEDFKDFVNNHSGVTNADKFIDEFMQLGSKFQGGMHQLDVLKNRPTELAGKTLYEFEGFLADDVSDCLFDMHFKTNEVSIFVEGKNYSYPGIAFINKQAKFNQLKAYFTRVSSIDNLHYYFRSNSGVTLDNIKIEFQKMLQEGTRADELFGVMSEPLRVSILGEANKSRLDIFKSNINSISPVLFKFIKLF